MLTKNDATWFANKLNEFKDLEKQLAPHLENPRVSELLDSAHALISKIEANTEDQCETHSLIYDLSQLNYALKTVHAELNKPPAESHAQKQNRTKFAKLRKTLEEVEYQLPNVVDEQTIALINAGYVRIRKIEEAMLNDKSEDDHYETCRRIHKLDMIVLDLEDIRIGK